MSKLSNSILTVAALSGCTAAFLVPTDASAFNRFAAARTFSAHVSRPMVQSFRPRVATFSHPSTIMGRPQFRPMTAQNFQRIGGGFPRFGSSFPRPNSFGGGFPHAGSFGGNFPHPNSFGGGFPHIGGNFPRPNSIGGGFPHVGSIGGSFSHVGGFGGTNFPRPNSFGAARAGFPNNGNAVQNRFASLTTSGAQQPSRFRGNSHSLISDIGDIGKSIGNEVVDVGKNVITGHPDKVPGTVLKDAGKVIGAEVKVGGDIFAPPPPKLSNKTSSGEPKGSTTSDASGFNDASKTTTTTTTSTKTAPVFVPNALVAARIAAFKAQQAKASSSTVTPSTASTGHQIECIRAPCPTHLGPSQTSSDQSGDHHHFPVDQSNGHFPRPFPSAGQGPVDTGSIQTAPGPYVASYNPGQASQPVSQAPVYSTPVQTAPLQTSPAVAASTPSPAAASPEFVFVSFQTSAAAADVVSFLQAYKVSVVEGPNQDGLYKLQLNEALPSDQLNQLVESMKSQSNIVTTVLTN